MAKYKVKIGIIGGSGLENPQEEILSERTVLTRESVKNEFGLPSSDLYQGKIQGVDVVLLSRHGPGHRLNPTAVNYRANIEALKLAGCTHILASAACGSLQESIPKGQLVVPDSFIDRTTKRNVTFYDNTSSKYAGVCHIPMEPAFHPETSKILYQVGKDLNYDIRCGGTVVVIEGPRFSSKAESNAMRIWGGDLIGMTTCPEVHLAKEAGLLYGLVAMATDYDCWRDCEDKVHAADVVEVFKKNVDKVKNLLIGTIKVIGEKNWDKEIDDLKHINIEGRPQIYSITLEARFGRKIFQRYKHCICSAAVQN
ncbi:S-methyl-5'-thioadenosine phosphorylase isoform X2 [Lasioglossum baleicum]|uniref:S-methyl-5'-thioadenosine phosphorylase isoform X2 n=1 Tax=Lasioglossum baleicum TaxID=434251 RepID=UPI003FCD40DA